MEMENKKQTKKDESSRESHGEDVVSERERRKASQRAKSKRNLKN